jgi:transposase InsO family protein
LIGARTRSNAANQGIGHIYVESFNSRVRDECLNINVFWSLAQARVVISDCKRQYNRDWPYSALGYQSPAHYAGICTHS